MAKKQTGKPNWRLSQVEGDLKAERFLPGDDSGIALSWAVGALLRPDGAVWGDPALADLPAGDYTLTRIDGRVEEPHFVLRKHTPKGDVLVSWTDA